MRDYAGRLAEAWDESDWLVRSEAMEAHYVRQAEVVERISPQRVIEIGTRRGYGLSVFALASPGARFLCVDGAVDHDSMDSLAHWHRVVDKFAIDAQLVVVNTRHVLSLPRVDLAYVDGDHSYSGALRDLELVYSTPTILADDCDNEQVKAAVLEFAYGHGRSVEWIDDGLRIAGLIT